MDVNWWDKGVEWFVWVVSGGIIFVYNWLNNKITKLEDRMHRLERLSLEDRLYNNQTYVLKVDLDKIEAKIDKLTDTIDDLKTRLLTNN